jgi:hypothetical protein
MRVNSGICLGSSTIPIVDELAVCANPGAWRVIEDKSKLVLLASGAA